MDHHMCTKAIGTIQSQSMDPRLTTVLEQEAQDAWRRVLEGDHPPFRAVSTCRDRTPPTSSSLTSLCKAGGPGVLEGGCWRACAGLHDHTGEAHPY